MKIKNKIKNILKQQTTQKKVISFEDKRKFNALHAIFWQKLQQQQE